jgi:glycerol-3-phosphate dehydrogenase
MTTYRAVAQEVVDLICRRSGRREACATQERPLVGDLSSLRRRVSTQARPLQWCEPTIEHLVAIYGDAADEVVSLATAEPALRARVTAEHRTLWAEVAYAVDAEMAQTADDVLRRRTMLGLQTGITQDTHLAVAEFVARRRNGHGDIG